MKKFVDCSPQWLKQVLESLASSSENLLVIAGHDWIDGRYAARLFGYGKMTAKMQAKWGLLKKPKPLRRNWSQCSNAGKLALNLAIDDCCYS